MPLDPFPSNTELLSRSPSLDSLPQSEVLDAELSFGPLIHTSPRKLEAIYDKECDDLTSEDENGCTEAALNTFLGSLLATETFESFRRSTPSQFTVIGSFGSIMFYRGDSLKTIVDRIYTSGHSRRRMGYSEIMLELIREGLISAIHFLETVIRNVDARELGILKWFTRKTNDCTIAAGALGTAACRNNFEAVNMLLDEAVDINGSVDGPHPFPHCNCRIPVLAYAQLPRFDEKEPGASDEMLAHLLNRGAVNSAGLERYLLGLLSCALRQREVDGDLFLSQIQSIVQRIHGFADLVRETQSLLEIESPLEICMLESEDNDSFMEGRLRVFEYLLDQGAPTFPGSPLAALISATGQRRLIQKLLKKTDNINAYANFTNTGKYVLAKVEEPKYSKMSRSLSPLQAAAFCGREEIIHLLLQNGADVNCPARGRGGVTPLQAICGWKAKFSDRPKKMRIIKLLLDRKANINAAPAWDHGLNALQVAAFVGDLEVAEFLVDRGADVNAPACKYGGATALVTAVRKPQVEIVQLLLEKGAVFDASSPDPYGDNESVLNILCTVFSYSATMGDVNRNTSRDYHEYEAEWANDPTYENKG